MTARLALAFASVMTALSVATAAQRAGAFSESRDHPAIGYTDGPAVNVVSDLAGDLEAGRRTLAFNPENGYLRSVLNALSIPTESQVLVYSETSFQARKINKKNPRAVYFTDHVAVGWVRGGDILEIAAHDPRQGTIFYQLPQTPGSARIARNDKCLACHLSWDTLGVPGPLVLSVHPRKSDDEYANGGSIDHGAPIAERWGGWFVTGDQVPTRHLGNLDLLQPNMPPSGPKPVAAKPTVDGVFDLRGFPTPHSDVVALLVLEHQARAANLITRTGWEYRVAAGGDETAPLTPRVQEAVDELVDYFLFVDEVALPAPVRGSSGFAETFAALGPRDAQGRSLRDLDLTTRLQRYPCSFMVHSPAFAALPVPIKDAVFGAIASAIRTPGDRKYRHLSPADRTAIAEILRATHPSSVRHFL